MIYFTLAIVALCIYMIFMILKARVIKKTTRFVVFLHGAVALLAIVSFLILWKKEFRLGLLSPFGLILILLGFLLETAAFSAIGSQAFMKEKKLIQDGVYSFVRNPIYLGLMMMAFGAAIFSFSLHALIYAVLLVFFYAIVILFEEKELQERFGKRYEAYKKRVPRLIPRL